MIMDQLNFKNEYQLTGIAGIKPHANFKRPWY